MKSKKSSPIMSLVTFTKGKIPERSVVILSFVILFFITVSYFYWIGNSIFFYQEKKSLFIFSFDFFQKYVIKPGGLLEYAGLFLTQFYYYPLYGSLLVSILLILFSLVFIGINKRLTDDRSFSLLFILIPSCIMLLSQKSYDHLIFYNLGFLLLSLWFLFSVILSEKRLSFLVPFLLPLFTYVVGSFTLIYLLMFIMYCLIRKKKPQKYIFPAVIIITAYITFIVFKEVLFFQPVDRLLCYPFHLNNSSGLLLFLYILIGYFIVFPLIIKISGLIKVKEKLKGIVRFIAILAIFSVTVSLLFEKKNPVFENVINLERSVCNQDWDAIINKYESSPSTDVIERYYYNLALSERGQLCDRLFFGCQGCGVESLALPRDYKFIDKAIYFYYSIGLTGEVHHLAVESMVINGCRPENIKFLIKTELIHGNYLVAERFIHLLKKTLYYRNWVEKYEKMLDNPSLIISDPELGEKMKLLPGKDFFVWFNDMQNVEFILKSNPYNKRAFEYKMARLLFEKDLEAIIGEVKKMKNIGYDSIPGHIGESVVEFAYINKEIPDLGGLSLNSDTELRFKKYLEASRFFKGDQSNLEEKMKNEWGNTFWYYYQYK